MIASLRNDVSLPIGESIIYTHTCKTIDIGGARWTDISRTRPCSGVFPQVQLRVGDMLRVDCFLSVCRLNAGYTATKTWSSSECM